MSALSRLTQHGDPAFVSTVRRVLGLACRPFVLHLHAWLSTGTLADPFREFFVEDHPNAAPEALWEDRFSIRTSAIPCFMSRSIAKRILLAGKTVTFVREACDDRSFVVPTDPKLLATVHLGPPTASASASAFAVPTGGAGTASSYGSSSSGSSRSDPTESDPSSTSPAAPFVDAVESAVLVASAHLTQLLWRRFGLDRHCAAIKRYILLGQGDFAQALLDRASAELSRRAADVSEQGLLPLLEAACASSTAASDDDDVLGRLSVRLVRGADRELGWDVFCLDYAVDAPLNVVLSSDALRRYMRVFRLLWRMRRVEATLTHAWMRQSGERFNHKYVWLGCVIQT